MNLLSFFLPLLFLLPQLVLSVSISSKIDEYPLFCDLAAKHPALFQKFRRATVYQNVLEHVSQKQGQQYLDIICQESPEWIPLFDQFRTNDALGSPLAFDYGIYGIFAPTTLRYIKVASDLKNKFGSLDDLHILEIGGGYGGQCKILSDVYDFASYTLIDLPECNELSKKYLELQGVAKVQWIDSDHLDELQGHYDLVISNYAFSELDAAGQKEYIDLALSKSARGYMTCNQINRYANIDTLPVQTWVLHLSAYGLDVKVTRENPLTHPNNLLLTWICRERLKNLEFGKEAAQIFVPGADGIAREQDGTEDRKFVAESMPPKTDSAVTIGIKH